MTSNNQKNNIQKQKGKKAKTTTEPFIPFPRSLADDFRNRLITYRELELYVWTRLHTNMYGIAIVSVHAILEDLPHFKSTDRITKIFRSLRRKKYIHYKERQGHRGSFNVRFGNWLNNDDKEKPFDELFGDKEVRSELFSERESSSEASPLSEGQSPKSDNQEVISNIDDLQGEGELSVRSGKNEKEIENQEEKRNVDVDVSSNKKTTFKGKILTSEFEPLNDAEARCKEIALDVGDRYMNFILSKLRHRYGGPEAIEEAYDYFLEVERVGEDKSDPIENRAAMFNHCLQTTIEGREMGRLKNSEYQE